MRLLLAIKAFLKAWRDPAKGEKFIALENKNFNFQETTDPSHLRLLTMLQQSSRLIDFFKEDLINYTDAQVGIAVRKIHADCASSLEELLTIRPVFEEQEGSKIEIPQGYDPVKIKVVGKIKGEPPFTGVLVHKGWKVHKRSLPKKTGETASDVLWPAEVEIRNG